MLPVRQYSKINEELNTDTNSLKQTGITSHLIVKQLDNFLHIFTNISERLYASPQLSTSIQGALQISILKYATVAFSAIYTN